MPGSGFSFTQDQLSAPVLRYGLVTAMMAAGVGAILLGFGLAGRLVDTASDQGGRALPGHPRMVQNHPVVHLVFWGPRWLTDTSGVKPALVRLFTTLPGSRYNAILGQYRDGEGPVANDVRLGGVWVDSTSEPPAVLDLGRKDVLLREVVKAIRLHGWEHGPDSQFMVLFQQGTDLHDPSSGELVETCGFHTWGRTEVGSIAVSGVKYVDGGSLYGGCGRGPREADPTTATSMTAIASHEYAETVANPRPNTSIRQFREVADRCNSQGFWLRSGVWAQKLWDTRSERCRSGVPIVG